MQLFEYFHHPPTTERIQLHTTMFDVRKINSWIFREIGSIFYISNKNEFIRFQSTTFMLFEFKTLLSSLEMKNKVTHFFVLSISSASSWLNIFYHSLLFTEPLSHFVLSASNNFSSELQSHLSRRSLKTRFVQKKKKSCSFFFFSRFIYFWIFVNDS